MQTPAPTRADFLRSIAAASATAITPAPRTDLPKARVVAQQVREEFLHAWNGYKRFAWGYDEVRPVS
ncbi:MAG: glycoside hydrolase family 47 protein, partial [Candidatus Eremiobacteraeota bacterium]|nr:glycoside hydrolase family 47 protein [Candidatus Eremiobacteraeota bacterium]